MATSFLLTSFSPHNQAGLVGMGQVLVVGEHPYRVAVQAALMAGDGGGLKEIAPFGLSPSG